RVLVGQEIAAADLPASKTEAIRHTVDDSSTIGYNMAGRFALMIRHASQAKFCELSRPEGRASYFSHERAKGAKERNEIGARRWRRAGSKALVFSSFLSPYRLFRAFTRNAGQLNAPGLKVNSQERAKLSKIGRRG